MTNKKKIYISGSISNNPEYRVQFVRKYRELEADYIVLTPLMINAKLEWEEYMHIDYAMIDVVDAVYFMKGWEDSKGATLEKLYAEEKGKTLIFE